MDEESRSGRNDQLRAAEAPRRIQSNTLLNRQKELVIVHNGREYRLRLTRNGKLILTA